jgi:predicted HTH domain antitoxin
MAITLNLSADVEAQLKQVWGDDLPRAALEALLIESYRRGEVSVGRIASILGMGVIEADAWLGQRGVPLNYTVADFESDCATADRLFGRAPHATGNAE